MKPDCDACQGIEPLTPETVANRPGLPALRYRAGTHGSFLESMIARLSAYGADRAKAEAERIGRMVGRNGQPPLPAPSWLRSRELSDPTIAMLDAWSTVGDILTFYQERIANEGYLSTAREPRSMHELANQIGYRLRPSLSSSVYLAFDVQAPPAIDLDVPPAPPHEVLIPKGTQARHVPGPGEQPQVFETREDLVARPEWNLLKPRLTKPNVTDVGSAYETDVVYVEGTEGRLKPGEFVAISFPITASPDREPRIRPETVLRQVFAVTPESADKRTRIDFVQSPLSLRAFKNDVQHIVAVFQSKLNTNSIPQNVADIKKSFTDPIAILRTKVEQSISLVSADEAVAYWLRDTDNDGKKANGAIWNMHWLPSVNGYKEAKSQIEGIRESLKKVAMTFSCLESGGWKTSLEKLARDLLLGKDYVDRLIKLVDLFDAMPAPLDPVKLIKEALDEAGTGLKAVATRMADTVTMKEVADKLNLALEAVTLPNALSNAKNAIKDALFVSITSPPTIVALLKTASTYIETKSNDCTTLAGRLPVAPAGEDAPKWDDLIETASKIVDENAKPDAWDNKTGPLVSALSKDAANTVKSVVEAAIKRIEEMVQKWIDGLNDTGVTPPVITDHVDATELDKVIAGLMAPWPDRFKGVVTRMQQFVWQSDGQTHPGVNPFSLLVSANKVDAIEKARLVLATSLQTASVPALNVIIASLDEFRRQRFAPVITAIDEQISGLKELEDWKEAKEDIQSDMTAKVVTWVRLAMVGKIMKAPLRIPDADTTLFKDSLYRRLIATDQVPVLSNSNQVRDVGGLGNVTNVFGQRSAGLVNENGMGVEALLKEDSDLIVQMLEGFRPELRGQLRREWLRREFRPSVNLTVFRSRASLFGGGAKGIASPKDEKFHVIKQDEARETIEELFLEGDIQGIKPGGMVLVGGLADSEQGKEAKNVGVSYGLRPFIVRETQSIERVAYEITGKSTRIRLDAKWRDDFEGEQKDANFAKVLQSTLVWCASEELNLVEGPLDMEFPEPLPDVSDTAVGSAEPRGSFLLATTVDGLYSGQYLKIAGDFFLPGELTQVASDTIKSPQYTRVVRVVGVENVSVEGKLLTKVTVAPSFRISQDANTPSERLKRSSVRIYANVVEATNGATVEEIIGNGEGQGAFQRFLLAQPKLTYLPAETPSGMKPEVEVRVNSVAWDLANTVGELEPKAGQVPTERNRAERKELPRKYLVAVDDDEKTFLTTGDGLTTGERLPTGITNVRAKYRVGGGRGGNVKEGTITQLASPPLNVTKVRNLMPATGGVEREDVYQARKNVPVAVMALDRLVSVADYESFVRRFAGIAKAQAKVLHLNGQNTVVVTIAGLDDIPIDRESLLYRNLVTAVKKYADPEQSVLVEPRELLLLMTQAQIKVEDGYQFENVRDQVERRILNRFNFENAELGQTVLLSDLIETIQNMPGVRYVDVDMFDRMRQFYETAQMVEHAKRIQKGVNSDAPESMRQPRQFIVLQPARKDEDLEPLLSMTNSPDERMVTVKRPSDAKASPAQLAYFADLAGTIILKEIK